MKLEVENHFRQKIMQMSFAEPWTIKSKADINLWKTQWTSELSSWHSPYKLLLDIKNLKIENYDGVEKDLDLLFKLFKGFFLRKAASFPKV
ncbi:hypothetical protein N9D31_03090, partial [Oligoflexaceae bacterium]|nr:hypothetical protein [Oligoflexaceae bacterium]